MTKEDRHEEEGEEEEGKQEVAGSIERKMRRLLQFVGVGGALNILEGGIVHHDFQLQQRRMVRGRGQVEVKRGVDCEGGAGDDLKVVRVQDADGGSRGLAV